MRDAATAEDTHFIAALQNFSTTREKILEHRFIASVCSELWSRGSFDFAVAHSEVDNAGYDLVFEVGAVIRHIQLKATYHGGTTAKVGIQRRLGDKSSGCVVWLVHDPASLEIRGFRWFGGGPGEPLPDLGGKVLRHTRGDKAQRPAHRELGKGRFVEIDSWAALTDRLFGPL